MKKNKLTAGFAVFAVVLCLCVSACAGAPASSGGGRSPAVALPKPAWVSSPYSAGYDEKQFVAVTGSGSSKDEADKKALSNLIGIFSTEISDQSTISTVYKEALSSGAANSWSETTTSNSNISTSSSLDSLEGVEIREQWNDGREYWSLAVMEKAKAARTYSDKIKSNQGMITNLITMTQAEKNSIEGFSRYQFSAAIADINDSYVNLLRAIGGAIPAGVVKGDTYRLEAQNIIKAIPIGVVVKNDKAGRIQGAFAKSLSEIGFRTGGTNSRYLLNVDVSVSPVELPNQTNKFARIELKANLTDTSNGTVLVPFDFNRREGHTSQSEAENRVYLAAEREISAEYKNKLNEHLSQIIPKK